VAGAPIKDNPGTQRRVEGLMPYVAGFPVYVPKCNDVMDYGYDGFVLEGGQPGNAPPAVRLTERWCVPLDMDVISHPDDVRRRAGILKKRLRLLCRFFESRLLYGIVERTARTSS
jgi:hypothetical protein